jgi:hypothetical protein
VLVEVRAHDVMFFCVQHAEGLTHVPGALPVERAAAQRGGRSTPAHAPELVGLLRRECDDDVNAQSTFSRGRPPLSNVWVFQRGGGNRRGSLINTEEERSRGSAEL